MRRLIGVLTADGWGVEREPQPNLARLDELLAGVRAAGLPVELVREGNPRPLLAGVDLAAYRVIQEALTNALRHAGPAHARVVLRYLDGELEVIVEDDGRGGPAEPGAGHGLIGMRERVAMFGGTLETGARPGGGFAVRATIPTREEA
jgi:signal transduction histidine kinase